MIMQSIDLLNENPSPTEAEVRDGLEGNLCRCTGYQNIVKAVLAASKAGAAMTVTEDRPHSARSAPRVAARRTPG